MYAELRPEDKARYVAEFAQQKPTAMIGDGINDAPALAGATVGIAMGAIGSDAAIESADVAFTGHDLRLIPDALQHTKRGGRSLTKILGYHLQLLLCLSRSQLLGYSGLQPLYSSTNSQNWS